MGMTTCKNCGKGVSKNASVCPACSTPTGPSNLRMGKCRTCGHPLEHSGHRYYRYATGIVVNGNTTGRRVLVHVPCPNCGEPKPLRYFFTDTAIGKVGGLIMILVFVPLLMSLPDYLDKHGYLNYGKDQFRKDPHTFYIEATVVSLLVLLPFVILFFRARARDLARRR
jgi:hypothetical protein